MFVSSKFVMFAISVSLSMYVPVSVLESVIAYEHVPVSNVQAAQVSVPMSKPWS